MKKAVSAISIIILWANPLVAAEYYVAPNGKDSNSGTSSSPWASIAKANTALQPGDTVYIKGGEYREVIKPSKSGQPGKYITYKAAPGETPVITDSPGKVAIVLDDRSYIRVDGLKVDGKALYDKANLTQWATLRNANYNIIENSDFKYAKGWSCISLLDGSHHNKIRNNKLDYCGAWSYLRSSDNTTQDSGDLINLKVDAPNNLIEGNRLTHGGHNLLNIDSSFNVVLNNTFNNDWGSGKGNRNVELRSYSKTGYNVFDGNVVVNTDAASDSEAPMAMKGDGTNQIVRRNFIFNNVQEGVSVMARPKVIYARSAKIYNNVIYNNGGPAWRLQHIEGGADTNNNAFKNNIAFNNRKNPKKSSYNADIFISIKNSGAPLNNNLVIANAITGSTGKSIVYVQGIGQESLQWFQDNQSKNFSKNIEEEPRFVVNEPSKPEDFRLKSDSKLIDAGDFLTKTTDAGTNEAVISVEDAGYFTDGFGLIEGDLLQIGTNAPVRIKKVDYSGNRITLQAPITWRSGDGVSLPYNGPRPDIGAHEFGDENFTAPPAPPTFL